jgi:hypothetical protein
MSIPKYPEVRVKLVGGDGNALAIIGSVVRAMRAVRLSDDESAQFRDEAMSGDYDHLLRTCMAWVRGRVAKLQ